MEEARIKMVGEPSWAKENLLSAMARLISEDGVLNTFSVLPAMLTKQVPSSPPAASAYFFRSMYIACACAQLSHHLTVLNSDVLCTGAVHYGQTGVVRLVCESLPRRAIPRAVPRRRRSQVDRVVPVRLLCVHHRVSEQPARRHDLDRVLPRHQAESVLADWKLIPSAWSAWILPWPAGSSRARGIHYHVSVSAL